MPLKKHGQYRFLEFEADLASRSLTRDGRSVTIGSRTFDLLSFFLQHPQQEISKEQLMLALWPNSQVEESNLSQHIFLLRKALTGSRPGERTILATRNRGYQFTAEVVGPQPESSAGVASAVESGFLGNADIDPTPERSARRASSRQAKQVKEEGGLSGLAGFFHGFRHPGPWQVLVLTATLAVLGFGGLFLWRSRHRALPETLGMVVAEFDNQTGDSAFDFSLQTAATIDLEQSPFLSVASFPRIDAARRALQMPAGQPLNAAAARKVCARIESQTYLTGSVKRFLRKYVVALEAFDCATGHSLATSRGLADSPDAVVAVLDKISADLRHQLGDRTVDQPRFNKPLFPARAASIEALKAYADASILSRVGKSQAAVLLFQHAVELDSRFAIAFADLGALYSDLGRHDLARASLSSAYELRDQAPEPYRLFIESDYDAIVSGDLQAGLRNNQSWSDEYPFNPVPLINLVNLKLQLGQPALALEPARRALALNPDDPIAYELLARAQLQLGQLEQAANTSHLAIYRGIDCEQCHAFLLQIAFLRLDSAEEDAQMAWAKGKPAEPFMLAQQGLINFAHGKARAGQALLERAADEFRRQGRQESANRVLAAAPRIEAELGLLDGARIQLTRLVETGTGEEDDLHIGSPSDIPVAWAHVGDTARAQSILKQELETHLTGTLWQQDFAPQIQAAIALNRLKPEDAIQALKPALVYDLRSFDVPALRGKAYLAARQPDLAEAEFLKIVNHIDLEPLSHNYPLAQLGLARALAQQGKTEDAQSAYSTFFSIWKEADPDLPRLKEAKAEYARLTAGLAGRRVLRP